MKRQIPLIAIAVFSMLLLVGFDVQRAFAISVQSNLDFGSGGVGYSNVYVPNRDIIIVGEVAGEYDVIDASTLQVIDTITGTSGIASSGANSGGSEDISCSNNSNYCIVSALCVGAGPCLMRIGVFDLSDYSFTTRTISNTTFASCRIIALADSNSGTTYATLGACATASIDGVWQINYNTIETGADSEILIRDFPLVGFSGVTEMCRDSNTGKIALLNVNTDDLYVFTPSTENDVVIDLTTINSNAKLHCDDLGYAYVADIDTDNIRIIDMDSATVVSTTSVTNPSSVVRHGENVYVSLTGSSSLQIYDFNDSGAMTQTGTIVGLDNTLYMLKGNSTRINAMGLESNLFDVFAVSDLDDDGSGSSGTNIVNGVNCALPANAQTLLCRLNDINTSGSLSSTSTLINQSSTNIICQVGILECTQDQNGNFVPTDPNIQTNGIGYLMVVLSMGVFVGILWVAGRGDLTSIPTFVWFIGTIAVIGTITAFGWIDPTFLVVSIVVIVAMAVAKAKGVFTAGQGLFAGEQR